MVNFQPPLTHRLLPFIIPILYCHCLSYQSAKNISRNESAYPSTLKYMSISSVAEIVSLVLGAILVELCTKKYIIILYLQVIWFVVLLLFDSATIYASGPTLAILLAFIFSTLKIALISYGASEYESRYSSELYVYFWFCYGAMIFSDLTSINLGCAFDNCTSDSKVALILGFCAFFSLCFFFVSMSIYTVPIPSLNSGMNCGLVLRNIWQHVKIIIFIAAMVFYWMEHNYILLEMNLVSEAMPMNNLSYPFGPKYVRIIYVLCRALFGIIFYLGIYDKYEKFMITQPIYIVVIGCLLMSLTVPSIMKFKETKQSIESKLPSKNVSWIYFGALASDDVEVISNLTGFSYVMGKKCFLFKYVMKNFEETISVNVTNFTNGKMLLKQQYLTDITPRWRFKVHGKLNGINPYGKVKGVPPYHIGPYGEESNPATLLRDAGYYRTEPELQYRFFPDRRYVESEFLSNDIILGPFERNKTLMPTVCFTCTHYTKRYDQHYVVLFKAANCEQNYVDDIVYHFKCSGEIKNFENNCQSVVPGFYRVRDLLATSNSSSVIKIEKGGFYYLQTSLSLGKSFFEIVTLIDPIDRDMLFPLLWPSILLMSIVHYLIVTSGLYYVYTQSHPKLKTISIGIWLCCTLIGNLQYNIFEVVGFNKLEFAPYIFIGIAVVIQILKLFILNFDQEWKSTEDLDGYGKNEIIS